MQVSSILSQSEFSGDILECNMYTAKYRLVLCVTVEGAYAWRNKTGYIFIEIKEHIYVEFIKWFFYYI